MEIVISTVASVAATIITVLGAIYYLDRKIEANRRELMGVIEANRSELTGVIEANRREHSAEIKEVRAASEAAHVAIRADLSDIKVQLAAHNERLKCIESHLQVNRPED